MALSSPLTAASQMASLGLRPPQFSEDVVWLPAWFQNLRTDGSNESVKESQILPIEKVKDLAVSQENFSDGKDINVPSREECGYKSCHLFLSGEDSSPISFASSPGNVLHFSLRLSSDIDSLFSSTQGLNACHNLVASSKVLSMQPVKTSVDFGENMHSMIGNHACEQNLLPPSIPKTVKKDGPKCSADKIDSVRQQKEKSDIISFKNGDISNAIELSIAASEALVIHDLVKMESVSETYPAEAVLEVALRVKQARLEVLEDGFHSSNEESDWSDSLSDLNDFTMAEAYEDVGLPSSISHEKQLRSSVMSQAKDVSGAEKYHGCDSKLSDREHICQLVNLDDNSAKKQLEVNTEMEMQQKEDSPIQYLCCEREKHSDNPGLGHICHQFVQNTSNVSALNQAVGSADLTSNGLQNCVNSSVVGNFEKENLANYLVLDRFKSRWLGGWTSEELDSSPFKQKSVERISKFFIRETSFLSESADDVPDETSCVQKHDSKCGIGSQSSIPSETLPKADEGMLHSQNVAKCSNLSLDDPLCSAVPCSISSELANSKPQSYEEIDKDINVPAIPEFEVDNFQRTSDQNVALEHRDEQIMSLSDGEDIPVTVTNMVQQTPEMLTSVDQTCRKHLSSLKTYSMVIPNQSLIEKCNRALLPTNQWMGVAVPLDKRSCKDLSASKCTDGNKNVQNHEHFDNHNSHIEITYEKRSNDLRAADKSDIPVESLEERRSTLILSDRTHHSLLRPEIVGNNINVEKHPKRHVPPKSFVQHQRNNNLNKLQAECNEIHDGHVRVRKQVRFSEAGEQLHPKRTLSKLESSSKKCSSVRAKRRKASKSLTNYVPHMKHSLTKYCRKARTKFIFQGTEFLLTGLSSRKERDMEALIRNSGGVILPDIPSPPNSRRKRSSTLSRLHIPIILCMRKLQTTKFLYGCAVGASILKVEWLTDCIASRTILQPEKYMILPNRNDMKLTITRRPACHGDQKPIFERVGIMLHGKQNFCTKLASVIKHGGGQVFKTLQWLFRSVDEERISIGAIVAEDKPCISRHLKYCALERGIPMMPFSWLIKSLYAGELLPFTEENQTALLPIANVPEFPDSADISEEI